MSESNLGDTVIE